MQFDKYTTPWSLDNSETRAPFSRLISVCLQADARQHFVPAPSLRIPYLGLLLNELLLPEKCLHYIDLFHIETTGIDRYD